MTKAFIEPIILQPESEALILAAFSKDNLKRIRDFDNAKKRASSRSKRVTPIKRIAVSA